MMGTNPRKSSYDYKLCEGRLVAHGYHPKCKKCILYKEKRCETPQYAAPNMGDFFCADNPEDKDINSK